jgi:hypothetical protein
MESQYMEEETDPGKPRFATYEEDRQYEQYYNECTGTPSGWSHHEGYDDSGDGKMDQEHLEWCRRTAGEDGSFSGDSGYRSRNSQPSLAESAASSRESEASIDPTLPVVSREASRDGAGAPGADE